jgi:hypothetical protein
MRSVLRLAAGAAMGFAVAGCNLANEGLYFREGIGTGLSRPELPEVTQIQDLYIAHICQQAGLPNCDDVTMGPQAWSLFVQAGMNDIDLRCDAYLAWLDNRKRSAAPILNQLAAMNTAAQAIMYASGSGATAITIAGVAFGLAADTFTNVNSRLLLEVNQSTVQSVVLGHQTRYRVETGRVSVRSRPMAIYLLRNYLRICMPFSIETSINNTVSVYHRVGPEGLRTEPLVTQAPRVAAVTVATPRDSIGLPKRRTLTEEIPGFAELLDPYNPSTHSRSFVYRVMGAICVPDNLRTTPNEITRTYIRIFEDTALSKSRNGRLDAREIGLALELTGNACTSSGPQNFFERQTYTNAAAVADLIGLLNKSSAGGTLPANTLLGGTRSKIRLVRGALAGKLAKMPATFDTHVTPDLIDALVDLP